MKTSKKKFAMCVSFVGNCDASAESREACLLEHTMSSLSVSKTFAKIEVDNGSVRPISDESRIHQELCNEGYESWWICHRLMCQIALQEQMFVHFAENKHGQTVLRKQDEGLFSSVIQKHSGECLKQRTC